MGKDNMRDFAERLANMSGLIALDDAGTTGTVGGDSDLGCQILKTRLEPPVPIPG